MASKVGIIGAGGHVGTALMSCLSEHPDLEVRGICRNEVTASPLRENGYDVRCGSVADPAVAEKLLGDCDAIVNCSGSSAMPAKGRVDDLAMLRSLARLRGPKRLVHFSSVAVYGTCVMAERNRFESPRPDWQYGRDKLYTERAAARIFTGEGKDSLLLRMGHVYGAGNWLSRSTLKMAEEGIRLPFGGQVPSNAIHVKNAAVAIRTALVERPPAGVYNLVDDPATSWRQVFDWNTQAVGMPPVGSLGDEESERIRRLHRRAATKGGVIGLLGELAGFGRSLPGSMISTCPAVKRTGLRFIATLGQPALEQKVVAIYLKRQAAGPSPEATSDIPPWLVCDGVPGPCLHYASELGTSDAEAVASWHARYSRPEAIATWESFAGSDFRR